jgi:hypothetical protein
MNTDLKQQEQALLRFLDDINCLDKLSPWVDSLNVFDILKIARTEIRHSNMLAWLLDPNANHGLGYSFLYGVLCKLPNLLPTQKKERMQDIDFLSLLSSEDLGSFRIRREWKNIDILIISETRYEVIAIENKIDSGLGKSKNGTTQLDRYDEAIMKEYNGWSWARVLLAPDQSRFEKEFDNSKKITWGRMEYKDISLILEQCYNKFTQALLPEADILINNYLRLLKKEIDMDSTELSRICNEIYRQHKGALDLIFDNKNDLTQPVAEICHNWLNENNNQIYLDNASRQKYIKFRSKKLNDFFNGHDNKHYYYQIDIRPEENNQVVKVQVALLFYKDANESIREELEQKMQQIINQGSKKNKNSEFNRWRTVISYISKFSVSYDKDFDQREKVMAFLAKSFETIESIIPEI